MGFLHVEHEGLIKNLGLRLDERGNVVVDNFQTSPVRNSTNGRDSTKKQISNGASESGVFAAGDAVSGASLAVRAIDSGRQAAAAIDQWLSSRLSHEDTKSQRNQL